MRDTFLKPHTNGTLLCHLIALSEISDSSSESTRNKVELNAVVLRDASAHAEVSLTVIKGSNSAVFLFPGSDPQSALNFVGVRPPAIVASKVR